MIAKKIKNYVLFFRRMRNSVNLMNNKGRHFLRELCLAKIGEAERGPQRLWHGKNMTFCSHPLPGEKLEGLFPCLDEEFVHFGEIGKARQGLVREKCHFFLIGNPRYAMPLFT